MLTKCIEERSERASRFLSQHGFQVINRNGQRISSNCANLPQLSQPDQPYSEIFLGKVPRDLFEDELLPVLLEVGGTIKKIRFMMDFSGYNRGFAFVKFTTTADAATACKLLDGRALRPNAPPIGARISFDNKCLYFGNLPLKCSASQLVRALRKIDVPGVVDARMADSITLGGGGYNSPQDRYHCNNPPSERFCHVEFESHEAATMARRMLLPSEEVKEQVRNPVLPLIMPAPSSSPNNLSRKIVPYSASSNLALKPTQSSMITPYHNYPVLQRNNRRTTSNGSNSTSSSSNMSQRFCTDWHPMMANNLYGGYNFNNNKVF